MNRATILTWSLVLLTFFSVPAGASTGKQVYEALGIEVKDVLTGTVLTARLLPGDSKQVASVVTYFTGKRDKAEALNVILTLFDRSGEKLVPIYQRDLGAEQGGYVGGGDLQLLDLNQDGVQDLIVCYDDYREPLIEQRLCEIVIRGESGFRTAWSGAVKYDATKAVRDVPRDRRDRFEREFDWPDTLRSKGATLFVDKEMVAVAGERLDAPKIVRETYSLREGPR